MVRGRAEEAAGPRGSSEELILWWCMVNLLFWDGGFRLGARGDPVSGVRQGVRRTRGVETDTWVVVPRRTDLPSPRYGRKTEPQYRKRPQAGDIRAAAKAKRSAGSPEGAREGSASVPGRPFPHYGRGPRRPTAGLRKKSRKYQLAQGVPGWGPRPPLGPTDPAGSDTNSPTGPGPPGPGPVAGDLVL